MPSVRGAARRGSVAEAGRRPAGQAHGRAYKLFAQLKGAQVPIVIGILIVCGAAVAQPSRRLLNVARARPRTPGDEVVTSVRKWPRSGQVQVESEQRTSANKSRAGGASGERVAQTINKQVAQRQLAHEKPPPAASERAQRPRPPLFRRVWWPAQPNICPIRVARQRTKVASWRGN